MQRRSWTDLSDREQKQVLTDLHQRRRQLEVDGHDELVLLMIAAIRHLDEAREKWRLRH